MDLSYGGRYETFRKGVERFLEEHGADAPSGLGGIGGKPGPDALRWQRLLVEHGYVARTIPREYGGFGAEPDLLESTIIDEVFTASGLSRGIGGQGPEMLVPTLLAHASEEQKQRWIRPTLRAELIWCQGYSEPGAGSDLASIETSAHEDGDDFVINGQKIWTSGAHYADMMFALVRTERDEPRHGGISYVLVPMDSEGLLVSPLKTMTGGAEFNQVFFTDVRVPKSNVVGDRGEGWRIANTTLRHERNMLGSSSRTERLLGRLLELVHTETASGTRAVESPLVRDRLAKLQARVLSMRFHAMRLLTCNLREESPGAAGLVVKLQGCQLNHDLAAMALDVLAELGPLTEDGKLARARSMWEFQYMFTIGLIIGGGTAQIQKNIIAERGLGLPREPKAGKLAKPSRGKGDR